MSSFHPSSSLQLLPLLYFTAAPHKRSLYRQPWWLSGLALPFSPGCILETQDRVPHQAPSMEPASPSACASASLSLSVSHESINKIFFFKYHFEWVWNLLPSLGLPDIIQIPYMTFQLTVQSFHTSSTYVIFYTFLKCKAQYKNKYWSAWKA